MNNNDAQPKAVTFLRARYLGRHGTERQIEETQIAYQRQACERKAAELGAEIIREYVEHGGTGPLEKRPVLRLMLAELLALHDARYVIVASGDRLMRNTADWTALELQIAAAGAEVVIAAGQGNTPLAKLIATVGKEAA